MSSAAPKAKEYVLGTGDDELGRLGLQHRLWSNAAASAWMSAGFGPGSKILDIGCGPGFASFDLAQLVTSAGSVLGIDESAGFIEHLNGQSAARGLPQLRGVVGDVQNLGSAPEVRAGGFDGAYARWVLCFVQRPQDVVAGIARALRPGGRIVVHDYFNYETMTTAPRSRWHDVLVKATADSWRARGGDPDVMGRFPALCRDAGLKVLSAQVHQRIARGGASDPMMHWPLTWWRTFAPKLVAMNLITQAQCDEALTELTTLSADPHRFIVCPPVYEMIAEHAGA